MKRIHVYLFVIVYIDHKMIDTIIIIVRTNIEANFTNYTIHEYVLK